jgi:hypothetical protein
MLFPSTTKDADSRSILTRELAATLKESFEIEPRHLDRPQLFQEEGVILFFSRIVSDHRLAPEAAFEETTILAKVAIRYGDASTSKVFHFGPMLFFGLLVRDSNDTRNVIAGDSTQVKGRAGQPLTAVNFRSDLSPADGAINAGDATVAKNHSGTSIP